MVGPTDTSKHGSWPRAHTTSRARAVFVHPVARSAASSAARSRTPRYRMSAMLATASTMITTTAAYSEPRTWSVMAEPSSDPVSAL